MHCEAWENSEEPIRKFGCELCAVSDSSVWRREFTDGHEVSVQKQLVDVNLSGLEDLPGLTANFFWTLTKLIRRLKVGN